MARAFRPCRQPSMYACSISSTVDSSGRFTVFEIAPEMNGCAAPIIFTWPNQWIVRTPFCGRKAQSNTGRCSSERCGAPSIVPVSSIWATMSAICPSGSSYPSRAERPRHGVVHDLHQAAADERLVLHERDVRLDAGRVAVHHEADRARWRDHCRLRVAVAVLAARARARCPSSRAPASCSQRPVSSSGICVHSCPVLFDHAQHRLGVRLIARERAPSAPRRRRTWRSRGRS